MAKPGPKRGEGTEFTELVAAKVTPDVKHRIMLSVLRRRTYDKTLPPRWGQSDFLREIITEYYKQHPDE